MPRDLSVDIEILQTQLAGLSVLIAAEGLKEYEADWLDGGKTITRDSGGRFASKASHHDNFDVPSEGNDSFMSATDVTNALKDAEDIADSIKIPKMDNVSPKDAGEFALATVAGVQHLLGEGEDKVLTAVVNSAFGEKAQQVSDEIRAAIQVNTEYNKLEPGTKVNFGDRTVSKHTNKQGDMVGPINQVDVQTLLDHARESDPLLAQELPKAAVAALAQWDEGVNDLYKFADESAKAFEELGKTVGSEIAQMEEWVADAGSTFDNWTKDTEKSVNEALSTAVTDFNAVVSQLEDSWIGADTRAAKAWIDTAEQSVGNWANTEKDKVTASLQEAHKASDLWVKQQSDSLGAQVAAVEGSVKSWVTQTETSATTALGTAKTWAESVEGSAGSAIKDAGGAISSWATESENSIHQSIDDAKKSFDNWASKSNEEKLGSFKTWASTTKNDIEQEARKQSNSLGSLFDKARKTLDGSLEETSQANVKLPKNLSSPNSVPVDIYPVDKLMTPKSKWMKIVDGLVENSVAIASTTTAFAATGAAALALADTRDPQIVGPKADPEKRNKIISNQVGNVLLSSLQGAIIQHGTHLPIGQAIALLGTSSREMIRNDKDISGQAAHKKLFPESNNKSIFDSVKTQMSNVATGAEAGSRKLYETLTRDLAKLGIFMPIAASTPTPVLEDLQKLAKQELKDLKDKYKKAKSVRDKMPDERH